MPSVTLGLSDLMSYSGLFGNSHTCILSHMLKLKKKKTEGLSVRALT